MTRKDKSHYSKKNSSSFKADPEISEALKKQASDGKISCAGAFKVAKEKNVSPANIGQTLDSLEIRITHCQLGLYGYGEGKKAVKPAFEISKDLKDAIEASLLNGKLSCKSAWEIAERFDVGKMVVSSACEYLKIKVSSCQIGAF